MFSSNQMGVCCEASGILLVPKVELQRIPGPIRSSSFLPGSRLATPTYDTKAKRRPGGRTNVVVEANLFSRVVRIVKSYADALLSAAEDPEMILEQSVKDMQEDLIKMKQVSASVMASQKSLRNKYEQVKSAADDWYRRAELALEKDDEELAREALKRNRSCRESAEGLSKQLESQEEALNTLIANTKQLESKIAEAMSKKDTLKARAQSAKASKAVDEMTGSLSTSSSIAAFESMEQKVLRMEAESEAVQQLVAGDELEEQFLALEGDSVEDDLKELKKKKLLGSTVRRQLPEGRPTKDAIDMELEELRYKANE